MKQSSYCLNFLKKRNRDYYISILFMPLCYRDSIAALYAFHLELVHISKTVKDPLSGMVRLSWWRDNIESGQSHNPIITALLKMIRQHNLSSNIFFRMCDARIFDFYHDTFPDCTSLKNYYEDTIGHVLRITCQIIAPKDASLYSEACHHGAVALGISDLMLQLAHTTKMNKLYIPQDILTVINTTRQALSDTVADPVTRKRVILSMLTLGSKHYNSFIIALDKIPKNIRPAFLQLSLLPSIYAEIKKADAKIFEISPTISLLRRQWILSYTALTGQFPLLSTKWS